MASFTPTSTMNGVQLRTVALTGFRALAIVSGNDGCLSVLRLTASKDISHRKEFDEHECCSAY